MNKKLLFNFMAMGLVFICTAEVVVAQDESAQVIADLARSPKLIDSAQVLADFEQGQETTRVIVNLAKPLSVLKNGHFKDLAFRNILQREVQAAQDRVIDRLDSSQVRITNRFVYIFGFSAEVTPEGLKDLAEKNEVVSINKDRILKAHLAQGIPLMNATTVRNTHNGLGISIAIIDTGIDTSHPGLGGGGFPNAKVIGGYDTGDDDNDPRPDPVNGNAHGTSCAGIAAGDLGTVGDYIGGVAYNAKLYAMKISTGNTGSASESDMIEGWEWCVTHQNDDPSNPIMVISTSFGGGYYTGSCDAASPAMTTAAANAVAAGISLFASSGNDGFCDGTGWPACISHVNAIGAVYDADIGGKSGWCIDQDSCIGYPNAGCWMVDNWSCDDAATSADLVTCYSNSANLLSLLAPSNNAYTADIVGSGGYNTGDYTSSFGGTSAACPYAAGAAACLQSAAMATQGAYLTPAEVRSSLTGTGDPVTDSKAGITTPRVNLGAAVEAIGSVKSFTVYNDGTADLQVTDMYKRDNDPWFDFFPPAPLPFIIPTGQARNVTVAIDWDLVPASGQVDDQIIVESNDPDLNPYPNAVFITAEKSCGDEPVIDSVFFDDCISETASCGSNISVSGHDPCGGDLTYDYNPLNGGNIIGSGADVGFDPPTSGPHPCPYTVEVTITSDVTGLSSSQTIGIYVHLAGDSDGNGVVNVLDKVLIRNHFGQTPGHPDWDPRADVDCNDVVNVLDKLTVRDQFGQTGCICPQP